MNGYLELMKRAEASAKEATKAKKAPGEEQQPAPVTDIRTAGTIPNSPDERRLLAAGWEPKERMGLTIWANPDTGFYCSQGVALHRLDNPSPVSPYRKLLGDRA